MTMTIPTPERGTQILLADTPTAVRKTCRSCGNTVHVQPLARTIEQTEPERGDTVDFEPVTLRPCPACGVRTLAY